MTSSKKKEVVPKAQGCLPAQDASPTSTRVISILNRTDAKIVHFIGTNVTQ